MLQLTARKKEWFTIDQDPSGDTQVEVLHLKPGEVADIESKFSQIKGKQMGEDFHTEIDFQLNEKSKEYVLRSVVSWKGFLSKTGKELPCVEQNKRKVMKEFGWFVEAIEKFREELSMEVESEEKDKVKN